MRVEQFDVEYGKARRYEIECEFPDFNEIANMDLPNCCKTDEVADRHGWGYATQRWGEYDNLLFMLGER